MSKRVYCLYRVSTKGQVEKDDIPMQKQRCREFAQEKGWDITKEFTEKGISGYKVSAKDRDAIQEIQKDATMNEFDILLVFMFDRLGRREDETPFVVEWFVKNGIEVWSAEEGQQKFEYIELNKGWCYHEKKFIDQKISSELELGIIKDETLAEFVKIINRMKNEHKIQAIILGCTELPLLFKEIEAPVECLDTMQIHIKTLVNMILES